MVQSAERVDNYGSPDKKARTTVAARSTGATALAQTKQQLNRARAQAARQRRGRQAGNPKPLTGHDTTELAQPRWSNDIELEESGWEAKLDATLQAWPRSERESMWALLHGKNDATVQPARERLRTLLEFYAPQGSVADRLDYETVALLAGYGLERGQVAPTSTQVADALFDRHEQKQTTFEDSLTRGIVSLTDRHSNALPAESEI